MLWTVRAILILLLLWLGESAESERARDLHFVLATLLAITLVLDFYGITYSNLEVRHTFAAPALPAALLRF